METNRSDASRGIVNERTQTVHKHEPGAPDYETVCNLTWHVTHENLRKTPIEEAITAVSIKKCGACFEDGGGY